MPCPPEVIARRPVLDLALQRSPNLKAALKAEITFWSELDEARLRVYERAVRPYLVAVRKSRIGNDADLLTQHRVRLECAEAKLVESPLRAHGIDAMIAEARSEVSKIFGPDLLVWLPDVRENFTFLA